MGNITETSEVASEFAVRIAVIGMAETSNGLNSETGFFSLFFSPIETTFYVDFFLTISQILNK